MPSVDHVVCSSKRKDDEVPLCVVAEVVRLEGIALEEGGQVADV